jgi:hypothetical protein
MVVDIDVIESIVATVTVIVLEDIHTPVCKQPFIVFLFSNPIAQSLNTERTQDFLLFPLSSAIIALLEIGTEQHFKEITTFIRNVDAWKTFWRQNEMFKEQCCFNVPNIVPTFVPIGNYCPLIIFKRKADRQYRSTVLDQEAYFLLHYTICRCSMGYFIIQDMSNIV